MQLIVISGSTYRCYQSFPFVFKEINDGHLLSQPTAVCKRNHQYSFSPGQVFWVNFINARRNSFTSSRTTTKAKILLLKGVKSSKFKKLSGFHEDPHAHRVLTINNEQKKNKEKKLLLIISSSASVFELPGRDQMLASNDDISDTS